MKSYVYKKGILERVYNLIRFDAERRKTALVKDSDIKLAICDQLTQEYSNYDFNAKEVLQTKQTLDQVMLALAQEEKEFITYVPYASGKIII